MTTYVLGAGPAGMAVVDGLTDATAGPVVVLERASSLGGLAQTLHWDGAGDHDLGPHKIFSLDAALVARVERLLPPEEWLTREKVGSIYMKGHYLPYPPSPFSLAGVFGLPAFARMVVGYGIAKLKALVSAREPRTFEEDLEGRLGPPLYSILFKPIAEKLWGDPRELDVKLSRGRVQTPSLAEVLGRLFGVKTNSQFEALTFRYPKGGLGRLWQAIEAKAKTRPGTQFLLGHSVTGLEIDGQKVCRIRYTANGVDGAIEVAPGDHVVSTLPLALTAKILAPVLPPHFPQLAERVIALNDLLLVFLHVNLASLVEESWVFVPDPDIVFHRLSEQESFDPTMTPAGSIVCCEIMSSARRPLAEKTDDELCAMAADGLAAMGYSDFQILNQRVIRLPRSYPVFRTGFERGLAELVEGLDRLENFRSIGRQGAFNYIGTLDAMDIGYGFADWLTGTDSAEWKKERERTNHYPVLD